jgi:NAD(P)-dependent dehydrogenase (short-subunit alcohol dehydrogenase family)
MSNKDRFRDKTIVVTGAGSGIGKATAERLAAEGARVIASDIDAGRLAQVDLGAAGVTVAGDLTDAGAVDRLFDACGGVVHGLANIAGIMDGFLPVAEVDDATWDKVIAVNLTATMRTTRAAVRLMAAAGGGAIVNIASEAALRGSAAGAAYTASKHAVIGLTRSTAFMHRAAGVRAHGVAPGAVRTGIDAAPRSQAGFAAVMGVLAAFGPSVAESQDLAAAIVWLLSDEAANINGAVLSSDAGWSSL